MEINGDIHFMQVIQKKIDHLLILHFTKEMYFFLQTIVQSLWIVIYSL